MFGLLELVVFVFIVVFVVRKKQSRRNLTNPEKFALGDNQTRSAHDSNAYDAKDVQHHCKTAVSVKT